MLVFHKLEYFTLTKHIKNYRLCLAKSRLKYLLDKKIMTFENLGSKSCHKDTSKSTIIVWYLNKST